MFEETQRFRQVWFWLILAVVNVSMIWTFGGGCYRQLILGQPWGERPMSSPFLVVVTLLVLGVVGAVDLLFFRMRMVTTLDAQGLQVEFWPMVKRRVEAADIVAFEAVTYRPIREYGGWGVRGVGKKRALNVSGNRGVQLVLQEERRLLLGSQRPEELENALAAVTGKRPGGV